MITTELPSGTQTADTELVERSRDGDHAAFAGIVARYQTLLCSLTFSICGDIHQSEELAHETFITAWRQLANLQEAGKLKSWLCGIARNLAHNAVRRQRHVPTAHAEALDEKVPASAATPRDEATARDEAAMLWRALEGLPENYREPMVLFYREGESVRAVAECMDLSEDAVKQRLARGRIMLAEHIERALRSALRDTAPGNAFTHGVLAALPAMQLSAKAATVAAATVKGSASVKGAGVLSAFTGLVTIAGVMFALWGRARNARSDRERKFLSRANWGFMAWLVAVLFAVRIVGGGDLIISDYHGAVKWSLLWIVANGVWAAYGIWMNRQAKRIQMEDGTWTSARDFLDGAPSQTGLRAMAYGGLAAFIFGPIGMLNFVALISGDRPTAGLLSMLAVLAWFSCARAVMRRPELRWRIFMSVIAGVALVILATLDLRAAAWSRDHCFHADMVVFLNFLGLMFFAPILIGSWLKRHLIMTSHFVRNASIATAVFLAAITSGLVFVCWH